MTALLNIGSITKIEVTLASNIEISSPNSNNQVSVANSGDWDIIEFTRETASFSETDKFVSESLRYDSTLKWKLAKQSPLNYLSAHKYDSRAVVIRITDANNTVYIIGSDKVPAYIKVGSIVPQTPAGYNGYNFSVVYHSSHPAYFVG